MEKADLRMGRKRNLSRQKDLEVPEVLQSQNALAPRIPYQRLGLLVMVSTPLIYQVSSLVSEQTRTATYSAIDGRL